MQFRRSGQRDERRRRVLCDTLSFAAAGSGSSGRSRRGAPGGGAAADHKSIHYGDAAFMDEQPRLTDLVPRRLPTFLLMLAAGLFVVALLEGLYMTMPRLAPLTSDGRVAAFDLDGEGSLAVWFSSMTLALAGLTAIVVFTVRRHRTDDYPGRYRVWLWAATCWFILSIDETGSLHEGFMYLMIHLTGTAVFGDGSIWWVAVYFFLLGAVGSRLLIDMRECWLSTAAFLGTAACYALAVVAQLGLILPESGARGVMLEEGAEMVGNLMLLLAMGLHARHVILDAEGLLPERREADATGVGDFEDEAEEDEEKGVSRFGRSVVVHPPHGVPRPAAREPAPQRSARTAASKTSRAASSSRSHPAGRQAEREEEPAPVQRKMTKAEKKALRKRLMKMAAERKRAG